MALSVSLEEIVGAGHPLLAIKPHWTRIRLGDVGRVLNGFAFKSAFFSRAGGMPLVRIRDVGNDASNTFYSGEFDERYVVESGDLLVGMDGDFNCARWRGPRALLNQRVCKIDVDAAAYLPRFLDYVLPGYLKAINDSTSSITVKHLSSRTVEDIPLPLPSMEEQRAIADEIEKQFSRLDEAVANLQRVRANLKRYKASVLKAAVEGRLVETESSIARREGRRYETGEQLLLRAIEERRVNWGARRAHKEAAVPAIEGLSELPEGWSYATCEQVCEQVASGSTPTPDAMFPGAGEIPFLKVYNLTFDGSLDFTVKPTFVSKATHQGMLARSQSIPGDVLMNIVGPPLGKVSVVPSVYPEWNVNQAIVTFRTSDFFDNQLLAFWLMSQPVLSRLERTAKATAGQFNLQVSTCRSLAIPLPPLIEQRRIVAEVDRRLSIVRELEAEVVANLKRAQGLRQAILAKAFSGANA